MGGRLSMITICPTVKLGDRISSIERSKAAALAAPSMIIDSPIPSKVKAAINVVFLPRLRGTLP